MTLLPNDRLIFSYFTRLGIEIGDTEILVHARLMTGRRYIFGNHGKLSLEKQWSDIPSTFALQASVIDLAVHDPTFVQYKNIDQVFTPKSICFMLGHPHYGAMGEVIFQRPNDIEKEIFLRPNR